MKKYLFIFIITLLPGLIIFAQKEPKFDTIKIKTTAQCEMCKDRIEEALAFTKGVKSSYIDLESKYLTVIYKPSKTDYHIICSVVSKSGYQADTVKADKKAYDKLPACCKLPEKSPVPIQQ